MSYANMDFELVADQVISLFQSKLNDKIAAINTEKNDGIEIDPISDNAYVFHTLNEETMNVNPVVLLEWLGSETVGDYGKSVTHADLFIAVVLSDEGKDLNITRRLFRYQRALREVIEENFELLDSGAKMVVQSQVPVELTLANTSFACKAIGLTVRLDMA